MSGIKGMKWKERNEKYPYKMNVSLSENQTKKLMEYCEKNKWNMSQAIRNIIFFFFGEDNENI